MSHSQKPSQEESIEMSNADDLIQASGDSLFSPEKLQDVCDRLEYIDAHECDCGETPHEDALHDLAHDDVPVLLRVIERLAPQCIETAEELDQVPVGAVVRSDAGTIAARFDSRHGVLFGMVTPFPWHRLALPAIVLWSPEGQR